jgi:hypothetical protein
MQDRRKAGCLYESGGRYYCNVHCPICHPSQMVQITSQRLWALGERHRNHVELDEEGKCRRYEYVLGQAELDRREAELGQMDAERAGSV